MSQGHEGGVTEEDSVAGDDMTENAVADENTVADENAVAEDPAAEVTNEGGDSESDVEPAESGDSDSDPEQESAEGADLSDEQVCGAIEALLLMAEEPVAASTLAEAVGVPVDRVTAALQSLMEFYDSTGRGFELRHVGGGWRYWTRAEHADLIGRWVVSGQQSKLSQASLETLAVVAYLQPVSRARISAVRGVSVDGVMRTLLARDLIAELGQDEQSGAVLFGTTDYFLERMGLQSVTDLPPMAPHLPDAVDLEAELSSLANPTEDLAAASDLDDGGSLTGGDEPAGHNGNSDPDQPEASGNENEQLMGERTDD